MCKKLLVLCIVVLVMTSPAFAGIKYYNSTMNKYWGSAYGAVAPVLTGRDTASSTVPENNWGAWDSGPRSGQHAMGQTFRTGSSGFTLRSIGLLLGNDSADLTVRLYDLGEDPLTPVGGWNSVMLYTDTTGAAPNGFGRDYRIQDGIANDNMLIASATFRYNSYGSPHMTYLKLDGEDQGIVVLGANESYALELIKTDASGSSVAWMRGGGISSIGFYSTSQSGTGEQMNELARTAAFALYDYVIPEPATMVLLGLGSLALLRRKK